MEYGETYAPISKLTTFRLLIGLAARNNWKTIQVDVVTAFLNPNVDDDTLFMKLPEGWPEHGPNSGPDKVTVVRLRIALYGPKHAPHLWYRHINAFLLSLGIIQSEANPNHYIRNLGAMLLLLYVEDMVLAYPPSQSRMQDLVATSTREAQYVAWSEASKEGRWLLQL